MSATEVDWSAVRACFPALENWTFLNTATFGQLPRQATETVAAHFAHRDRYACWNFLDWFTQADDVRRSVARLVHAGAEDIAFVTNAASAMAILLNGLDWRPGDRVITLANEFPNNLYNPAVLRRREVETVETTWDRLREEVTPRTRLVMLSTVNYITGFRPPIRELSEYLRERGVLLYVDGTQSLGALQFDAGLIQPAMLGVDAYKWLLGPTGSGFVYVRPDVREAIAPSVIGWRSHKDWRRVDNLHHGMPEFSAAAERYEGGMLSFPSIFGMGASVDLVLRLGPEAVERRVVELAEKARAVLRRAGAALLSDEAPHHDSPVVAARFDDRDASALAHSLKERRILVSARHGYLRVSTHYYNNEADLENLEEALADCR